jgi:hypothetical protein
MQRSDERRQYHSVRYPMCCATRRRWVTGGVIACLAATFMASDAAAQTPDPQDAFTVGNAGIATASSDAVLTTGDIDAGGNTGNTINIGDIVNSTAEINGGTVLNPTYNIISMPAGTQIATADGGDGTHAQLDEAGGPPIVNLDVQDKSKTNTRNENEAAAEVGDVTSDSTSTSNATNNNSNENNNTNTNTNTGTNTNTNTGTNTNTNTGTNTGTNTNTSGPPAP